MRHASRQLMFWLQDVKYAVRRLGRSPAFTVVSVLTVAIGIGATTAMFTVVLDVLLRPLRYPAAEQLVVIRESITTPKADFSDLPANANHLVFWQQQNRSFSAIAALLPRSMPVGGSQTEEIGVAQETSNLTAMLGFQPRLGRTFTAEEETPGHDVILLSDGFWKRRFGAAPAVVGTTIPLDGRPYLVVGVLPPDFALPDLRAVGGVSGTDKPIEAFIPFGWTPDDLQETEGDHDYFAIGRLRPGFTTTQAAAEMNALQRRISQQTPDKVNLAATIIPFQEYLVGSNRRVLLLLLAAVSGILLIACINLTNLLMARVAGRGHESALRIAIGATRAHMIRHALMEPILLASFGCAFGTIFAVTGLPLLVHHIPTDLPRLGEVQIDLPVLAFALGVSLLAAGACGFLPAWRFVQGSPQGEPRNETRTTSTARHLRQFLVMSESAASVALVLLAGLFITSLLKLLHVDRGFQAEHVLSAEVVLPASQYGDATATRNEFYQRTLERLRQIPSVSNVGAVSVLPLDGDNWGDVITKPGNTDPFWQRPEAHFRWITPGYFETLRVPLLAGRFLTEADRGRNVALISRHVAETVWPGQNCVGQKFTRGDSTPFEIIGVVGDVRSLDLAQAPPRMVYVPYWYRSRTVGSLVLRISGDPAILASAVRKAIGEIDAQVAVPEVRTMDSVVDLSVASRRFQMQLLFSFAACSLLLAGLGVYGVVAYSVVQRTQEIGIRMALGADRGDVCRLILAEGVTPVLIGAVVGAGLAIVGSRIIVNLLFDVRPTDPLIAVISCAIILVVGVVASLLPASRATIIDPMRALRSE
jgi:predicted permease